MAVGDILQLNVNQDLFSDSVQNVLYYKVEVVPAAGAAETDLAGEFISFVLPTWQLAVDSFLKFQCIQTQKVFPAPVTASFDAFVNLIGLAPGFSIPGRNCALIQKFNPAVSGKGKKGRVYVSGFPEAGEFEGRLTVAQAALLNNLGTALIAKLTGLNSGEYQPVWATKQPAAPFAVTGSEEWTNFVLKPVLASQKRRVTPIQGFI